MTLAPGTRIGLHEVLAPLGAGGMGEVSAVIGPVQYRQVDIDVDRQLQCVQNGLHLIALPDRKLVAYVRSRNCGAAASSSKCFRNRGRPAPTSSRPSWLRSERTTSIAPR